MERDEWDESAVLRASHDWLWVPPGFREIDLGWMRGLTSDESPTLGVAWVDSELDPEGAYAAVAELARDSRCRVVNWTVSSATRPAGLEALLVDKGAELKDTTKILALELTTARASNIEVPPDVGWTVVDSPATWDRADEVARSVWGGDAPTPDQRRSQHEELEHPIAEREGFQVLGTVDGAPASTGGVTIAGKVARLWGACTHPRHRGRGAYRATVRGRLETAQDNGCTLALSNALADTSAPTLESLGFVDFGLKRSWATVV